MACPAVQMTMLVSVGSHLWLRYTEFRGSWLIWEKMFIRIFLCFLHLLFIFFQIISAALLRFISVILPNPNISSNLKIDTGFCYFLKIFSIIITLFFLFVLTENESCEVNVDVEVKADLKPDCLPVKARVL